MASGGDPMDWEPEVHQPVLNRTSTAAHEWDLYIPGQFETPSHVRRKRSAEEAGFTADPEDGAYWSRVAYLPSEQDVEMNPHLSAMVDTSSKYLWSFWNTAVTGVDWLRGKLKSLTASSQTVEIRHITADGFESVKRRTISNQITPTTQTAEQIARGEREYSHSGSSQRDWSLDGNMGQEQNLIVGIEIESHPTMTGSLDIIRAPHKDVTPSTAQQPNTQELSKEEKSRKHREELLARIHKQKKVIPQEDKHRPAHGKEGNQPKSQPNSIKFNTPTDIFNETAVAKQGAPSSSIEQSALIEPQTSDQQRHARIAIDPQNGLPQESVGHFMAEEPASEWVLFSSAWTKDQVKHTNMSLEQRLESFERGTDETKLPPITPGKVKVFPTSIATNADPTYSLPPNRFFTPTIPGSEMDPSQSSPCITSPVTPPNAERQLQDSLLQAATMASLSPEVPYTGTQQPTNKVNGISKVSLRSQSRSASDSSTINKLPPLIESKAEGTSRLVESNKDKKIMDQDTAGNASKVDEIEYGFRELKMSNFKRNQLVTRKQAKLAKKAAEEQAAAKIKAEEEEAALKARFQRRMPKEKLIKPLSKIWESKINEAMDRGEHATLTTTLDGTELRRKDLLTVLGDTKWLNDEIINGYIEWVVQHANRDVATGGIPKVVAFNSFFYDKLSKQGPAGLGRWTKRKKIDGLKLLEVERVLIPVNNASHWTLIVVNPKERTIEYLDSFGGNNGPFVRRTMDWLEKELGSRWVDDEWTVLETESARQYNGYDCGVFAITNAECVAGSLVTTSYNGKDMAAQRRRIAAVLLNRGFGGDLVAGADL